MKSFHLLTDEIGAAAIEYALLGMLPAVVITGSMALTGAELSRLYRTVCGTMSIATGGGAC